MIRPLAASLAATVLATSLVAGGSLTALAAEPDPTAASGLASIQKAGAAQSERRIIALENTANRLEGMTALSDADKAPLLDRLHDSAEGVRAVQGEIASATERTAAWEAYRSMFTEHRVYAVVLPQVLYAAAADQLTAIALPKVQDAHDALAKAVGSDSGDLTAQLAAMQEHLDAASSLLDGLAERALAVTPAAYNADHTVLVEIRDDLQDATLELRLAADLGREIVEATR